MYQKCPELSAFSHCSKMNFSIVPFTTRHSHIDFVWPYFLEILKEARVWVGSARFGLELDLDRNCFV